MSYLSTRRSMIFGLVCLLCCLTFGWMPVAEAAHCRTIKGQEICIASIRRSAKRYWEYQAILAVAGVPQPKQVYDCRSRVIIEKDDTIFSFGRNDPGSVVCDLFRERSKSMRLSDLAAPRSR